MQGTVAKFNSCDICVQISVTLALQSMAQPGGHVFAIFTLVMLVCVSSSISLDATADDKSLLIVAIPHDVNFTSEALDNLIKMGIRNNSNILSNITSVVADSGLVMCSDCLYTGSLLGALANLSFHGRLENALGIVGLMHPSVLHALRTFLLPIVSLVHFGDVPYSSNTYYLTAPTSTVVDSVVALAKSVNANSVGVITDGQSSYYTQLSRVLLSKLERSSDLTITLNTNIQTGSEDHIINSIVSADAKVVFLSMNRSVSMGLVYRASTKGLIWPKYALIMHSFQFDSLEVCEGSCGSNGFFEGVFVLQPAAKEQDKCMNSVTSLSTNEDNSLSRLLYNAVWVLLSLIDHGNDTTMHNGQSLGCVNFDSENYLRSDINIYQVLNESLTIVGVFDGANNILTNFSISMTLHYDTEDNIVLRKLLPTYVIIYISIVLCFLLNTLLLVLYVYFRAEPDIKATSMSLSLLIFVGCYLLIGFAIVAVVHHQITLKPSPLWQLCVVNTWLSGLGISIPLILATLLVKMLRIHYIFTRTSRIKFRSATSDCALAIYALLMLVPNVIVLVCWVVVDPFFDDLRNTAYPEFNAAVDKYHCRSSHQIVWFGLLLVFYIALSIAVIVVAVKTRKVRLKHFKDTKKVNLLIFLLLFIVSFTLSFWLFFTELYDHVVLIILCTGHLFTAFLCQLILFAPKVWPPLKRRLMCQKHSRLVTKSSSDNLSSGNVKTVTFAQ